MKYLCLDIGNVLCKVSFDDFLWQLACARGMTSNDVDEKRRGWEFLQETQALHDLSIASLPYLLRNHMPSRTITEDETIDMLVREWNKTITKDQIVISEVSSFIKECNGAIKIALLSNIGKEHIQLIPGILGEEVFSHCIPFYSCEVGARKPTYTYYQSFLSCFPNLEHLFISMIVPKM